MDPLSAVGVVTKCYELLKKIQEARKGAKDPKSTLGKLCSDLAKLCEPVEPLLLRLQSGTSNGNPDMAKALDFLSEALQEAVNLIAKVQRAGFTKLLLEKSTLQSALKEVGVKLERGIQVVTAVSQGRNHEEMKRELEKIAEEQRQRDHLMAREQKERDLQLHERLNAIFDRMPLSSPSSGGSNSN
uniref:Uncharacterized protein n=2 Tax=Pyramimonas obovata TaxID=1411642 RepID=A0A7S0QWJ0_9CHLO|mmetsp:Transcript_15178/g.32713  ORF Transcript_15178/g.32713 Transcript_15178/m.32713 type:complete len:186 (+) Transcript_15178:141-698(+)